jgi:hypothetical protein
VNFDLAINVVMWLGGIAGAVLATEWIFVLKEWR